MPSRIEQYPEGMAITKANLSSTRGCDSVLQTVTVQANGAIGACCGLGMRLVPELKLGDIGASSLSEAMDEGENDFLKRWIRLEGPERILDWASSKDESIEWEGQYAHRCQACLRLYKDEAVRDVIAQNYKEKIPDVVFGEYLMYHMPAATEA